MENKDIYIKYQENQPVLVETLYNNHGGKRDRPLTTVAHVVAAYKTAVAPRFDSTPTDELTLHLPEGVDRSALEEDCFAATDSTGTALDSGCLLSALGSLGSKSKVPLVVKSNSITCLVVSTLSAPPLQLIQHGHAAGMYYGVSLYILK